MWNDLVLLVHIIGGIIWLGTIFFVLASVQQARKVGGIVAAADFVTEIEWLEKRIFPAAPLVTLLAGVGLVLLNDAWSFSDPWVYLALGLFVASLITAVAFGGKAANDMQRIAESDGRESPEFEAAFERGIRVWRVDSLIVTAILALMVFKPFA